MIKTSRAKRKSQTHFEQVPLEVVEKLLGGEAVKTDRAGPSNLIVETAQSKAGRDRSLLGLVRAEGRGEG
jgi:hypothetical protein